MPGPISKHAGLVTPVLPVTREKRTKGERHKCRAIVDEFPFWHWGLDQSFCHKPAVRPESVRERREVFGVTLDGEEVDRYQSAFRDVADPSQRCKSVVKRCQIRRVRGVQSDILWSHHLSARRIRVQHGPRRTTRHRRRKTESFTDACFQVIHLTEMLCRDLLSPWVELVNFRPKLFELLLILEKVEEQRRENCSGSVES